MLKNQRESLLVTESLLSENQNQIELYQTGQVGQEAEDNASGATLRNQV
jgi:hypothetical protein